MFFDEGGYVTIPVIAKPGRRVSIIMFCFSSSAVYFKTACLHQEFKNNNDKIKIFIGCFYKER